MENITENKIRKWIESFHLSNNTETDRHITDFFSPNLERKEWLKKGGLLSKECQNYIDSHEYPIRVYLGISLKDRRKEFIPEDLTLSLLDKWTPPFIILSKLQMDDFENYSVANKLTSVLHMKTYFWQYKERGLYATNIYIALK